MERKTSENQLDQLRKLHNVLLAVQRANRDWMSFWEDLNRGVHARAIDTDLDIDLTRTRARNLDIARARALARARNLDLDLDLARDIDRDLDRAVSVALDHAFARTRYFDRDNDSSHANDLNRVRALAHDLDRDLNLARYIEEIIVPAINGVRSLTKAAETVATAAENWHIEAKDNTIRRRRTAYITYCQMLHWFPDERFGYEDHEEMLAIFRQGYADHHGRASWLAREFTLTALQALREQWRARRGWLARLRLS